MPIFEVSCSQLGIEEEGGELTAAVADIVADTSLFAEGHAFTVRSPGAGEDTNDAGGEHDVLIGVLVVHKGRVLLGHVSSVTVGEHSVGGLSQADVSQVEFGKLVWHVEVNVCEHIESAGHAFSERVTAVSVEGGSEAIDGAD